MAVGGSDKAAPGDPDLAFVQGLARALLRRVDRLTDDLVERIVATEPAYTTVSTVAMDDLRLSCRTNLERIVQSLGRVVPAGEDPYDAPAATGRRRAAQGMPLEAVLHSYRLGGRVVWDGIVDLATGDPVQPGDRILLQVAGRVWEEIDRFSAALASAYRDEELRLRSQHRHQQQRDVAALLAGPPDTDSVHQLADRLGLADGEPTVVVCVLLDDPDQPLFGVADSLAGAGLHAVWALARGMEVGIARLSDRSRTVVAEVLRSTARQRVGLSAVYASLAGTVAAARLAELAARTMPTGRHVVCIEERLPEALVLDTPDISAVLLEQTVQRVRAHGADGDVLLDTIEALLAENGSFSKAGERLFCHRNTVIHRVGRVAALSGHDPATHDGRLLWSLGLIADRAARRDDGVPAPVG